MLDLSLDHDYKFACLTTNQNINGTLHGNTSPFSSVSVGLKGHLLV